MTGAISLARVGEDARAGAERVGPLGHFGIHHGVEVVRTALLVWAVKE